jgi:hypothetical protein
MYQMAKAWAKAFPEEGQELAEQSALHHLADAAREVGNVVR